MSLVAAMAVAVGLVSGGRTSSAQVRPVGGPRLEIAGVGVRMSVPEAVAALREGGWTVTREPGTSWRDAVEGEVERQRGRSLAWRPLPGEGAVAAIKGDERIGIQVRPSARGGEVESMSYGAPFAGRSLMEMAKQLHDRYGGTGKGSAGPNGFFLRWCDPVGCGPTSVRLDAETGGSEHRLRLTLFWSDAQHTAYDRLVGDAVRARSGGGGGRPSF